MPFRHRLSAAVVFRIDFEQRLLLPILSRHHSSTHHHSYLLRHQLHCYRGRLCLRQCLHLNSPEFRRRQSGNFLPMQNNLTNVGSSKQTHTELIDYTTGEFYSTVSQAASDTFSTPLSSNVICFFLSALHIISTETNVVQLDLSYSIIDANRYSMSLTAGFDLTISKIEFSKVFYNTQHFSMGARKCMFSYDWLISTPLTASNYFNLPAVAMNSQLIVGIKSLSVPTGN